MEVISIIICIVLVIKTLLSIKNMFLSVKFLSKEDEAISSYKRKNILIFIPVIREQNVIEKTLEHFKNLNTDNIGLTVAIIGTKKEIVERKMRRENLEKIYTTLNLVSDNELFNILNGYFKDINKEQIVKVKSTITLKEFCNIYDRETSTGDVVCNWINKNNDTDIKFEWIESPNIEGDRASQLNYGVKNYLTSQSSYDILGVYDADSLPEKNVLCEISVAFDDKEIHACQQPLHFIDFYNENNKRGNSSLLSASSLYQTNWSLIKELPNLIKYSKYNRREKPYLRNLYLNGHGEFFRVDVIKKFNGFPTEVITDGVQIGYRLSMCNFNIKPIKSWCSDDMPTSNKQMITQHSRWYGGCNRIYDAYKWSKSFNSSLKNNSLAQYIDGVHMQFLWAFAPIVTLIGFLLSFNIENKYFKYSIISLYLLSLLTYNYIVPLVGLKTVFKDIKYDIKVVLLLPIAPILKCIGPQLYFLQIFKKKIFKKDIIFSKVER